MTEAYVQEGITDTSDVDLALRRAQYWVLHPTETLESVRGISVDSLREDRKDGLRFSRNVICLDISGPDLIDISFVDLPGMHALGMPWTH